MRLLQYVDNDAIETELYEIEKGLKAVYREGGRNEGNCTEGANC